MSRLYGRNGFYEKQTFNEWVCFLLLTDIEIFVLIET